MSNSRVVTTVQVNGDEALGFFRKLDSSIRTNVASGVLLGNALTAGINAVTKGAQLLGRSFSDAGNMSLKALQAANNLTAEISGLTLVEARENISLLTNELSRSAAVLPGATSEYVALANVLQNDVARAYANPDGTLNTKGWLEATNDITSLLRVMGEGYDQQNIERTSQKLVSGGVTLTEAATFDWVAGNQAFLNILRQSEVELGKEWKQFSQAERIRTLRQAKDTLLSKEYLAGLVTEPVSLIAAFRSQLFDPNQGVFGLMRDLDENLDGSQSVFSAISGLMNTVLGPQGLFMRLGVSLGRLGVSGDTLMQALYEGIEWLDNLAQQMTDFLGTSELNDLATTIGEGLAGLVNGFADYLTNDVDYGALARDVMNVGRSVLKGIGSFVGSLSWKSFAIAAGVVIGGGLLVVVGGFVATVVAGIVGLKLAVGAAIVLATGAVVQAVRQYREELTTAVASLFSAVSGAFVFAATNATSLMVAPWQAALDAILFIPKKILGFAQGIHSRLAIRQSVDNLRETAARIVPQVGPIQTRFGGDVRPLMDAMQRERSGAPSGSSLVVANSSEAILNQAQQRQFARALNGSGGVNIGSIVIHSAATNAAAIADDVINELTVRLQRIQETYVLG